MHTHHFLRPMPALIVGSLAASQPPEGPSQPQGASTSTAAPAAPQASETAAAGAAATPTATPAATPAAAAPLVISTDRPSFSDSTGIQPLWHLNVETGFTYTYRDRDETVVQRFNGPEVLLRLGVIEDRLELRASTSGYVWNRVEDASQTVSDDGMSDAVLGFKLKLIDQDGWVPRLAFLGQATLGGGSEAFSSQLPETTLKMLWSIDLGQPLGEEWRGLVIGGNANLAFPAYEDEHYAQGQGSIYLSFPIATGFTGFVEYFIIGAGGPASSSAQYVDVGATYLLSDRVQLDARIGVGLNDEADSFFAGAGVSFLF